MNCGHSTGAVLELQHSKILQLEEQAEQYRIKYENLLATNGSINEMSYVGKYRELEKQHKDICSSY